MLSQKLTNGESTKLLHSHFWTHRRAIKIARTCDRSVVKMMSKAAGVSSVSKRRRSGESLNAQASLACLKVDSALERAEVDQALDEVIQYLRANPSEVLATRRMLLAGMMKPKSKEQIRGPKMGPGNSRVRHLSKMYLEHCVLQLDERMNKRLLGQMAASDKAIASKLYMYALGCTGDDPLPHRADPDEHVRLAKLCYTELGMRLRELILDESFTVLWEKKGIYSLVSVPGDGVRFTHVRHICGQQWAIPSSTVARKDGNWVVKKNWDFQNAFITDGESIVEIKVMCKGDFSWHARSDKSPHSPKSLEDKVMESPAPCFRKLGDVVNENDESEMEAQGSAEPASRERPRRPRSQPSDDDDDDDDEEEEEEEEPCFLDGSGLE